MILLHVLPLEWWLGMMCSLLAYYRLCTSPAWLDAVLLVFQSPKEHTFAHP